MVYLFDSETGSNEYLQLRNRSSQGSVAYRKWLEEMWTKCEPYLPDDFLPNFQNGQGKLKPYTWELILNSRFLEHGAQILKPTSSNAPDITILHQEQKILFECALPTRGERGNPNSVSEPLYDGNAHAVETDKHVLRCTSAIQAKINQHQSWLDAEVCNPESPIVIALHGRNLMLDISEDDLPDVIRAVCPVGGLQVTFYMDSDATDVDRAHQPQIGKSSGKDVETLYFANEEHAQISGLLYSCDWGPFFGSSAPLYSFLPNPFATNPLPTEVLPFSQICYAGVDDSGQITVSLDPADIP